VDTGSGLVGETVPTERVPTESSLTEPLPTEPSPTESAPGLEQEQEGLLHGESSADPTFHEDPNSIEEERDDAAPIQSKRSSKSGYNLLPSQ